MIIMSKEMQLLRSKMKFYKRLINELDCLNYVTGSNQYSKEIEEYQDKLAKIYKRVQEIKKRRIINEKLRKRVYEKNI